MRRRLFILALVPVLNGVAARADEVSDLVAKLTQPLEKEGGLGTEAKAAVKKFDALTADQQTGVFDALIELAKPSDPKDKKPELPVVTSALAQLVSRAKTPAVRNAAVKRLEPLTTHAETEVRTQSVWTVGRLQVPESFPILIRAAAEDKSPRVRKTARNALGDVLANTPYAAFATQLATFGDESLYELLNEEKGTFAERVESAVPHIAERMNDKAATFEERWRATRLLGRTHSAQAEAALVSRLLLIQNAQSPTERPNDPQLNLRVQAAESLVLLGRRTMLRDEKIQDTLRFNS